MSFIRCRNCNTYFEASETEKSIYCSASCSLKYQLCRVCGKYYPVSEDNETGICSSVCGQMSFSHIVLTDYNINSGEML